MNLFDVYALNPLTITRGEGAYVWDDAGHQYLDMYGGHAVISIGHGHPHWQKRIKEQMKHLSFYSNSVHLPIQKELATKLGRVSGKPDYQLFLVNSGAEANENALKLASFHTGRKGVVAFTGAFHGRTSLAVAATHNPAIVAPVNETENVTFLPFNDVAALEAHFAAGGEAIAAVIVEGIQGVGGIREASKEFLLAIRRLCTEYGAVYIADSVQCGYGRTGIFYSHDWCGAHADIYTMAKGMGNGFPIGGIAIAPQIAPKMGMLGTTFGGAPLACATALAVLEVMEGEDLMRNAERRGGELLAALQSIPGVENVRGRGLMIGFDLPNGYAQTKKDLLLKQRVFTGEAKPNTIRLLPSLALQRREGEFFLDRLKAAIATSVRVAV